MRKMYMMVPTKTSNQYLSAKTQRMANQLEEQKALNAELLRVCSQQRQLLHEQSEMIEEILEEMGR